jgi:hypothetical protein
MGIRALMVDGKQRGPAPPERMTRRFEPYNMLRQPNHVEDDIHNMLLPGHEVSQSERARSKRGVLLVLAGLAAAFSVPVSGLAAEHHVLKVYTNAGNVGKQQVPAGVNTTLDQTTINCPRTTCTFILSAMQSIESADSQGEWAIVGQVDGIDVNGGAPYQGFEPIASYVTGSWQGSYQVTQGVHTVTFAIYPMISVILNQWSDTVLITTP